MNREWKNDTELFNLMKSRLFTAVTGDIMDRMGYLHQFLPPAIRPLHHNMIVAGRAMTVVEEDLPPGEENMPDKDLNSASFGLMFKALDDLKMHEVYLCTGASPRYALWGELMSTRAQKLGAAGAVVNGYSRDSKGILNLGFATFSTGKYARDQAPRGKVVDFRVDIEIEDVHIRPGDIVFGDEDGVCIIPREVENEVLRQALIKVSEENKVRKAIEEGMGAEEAYRKFGIF